MLEEFLGKVQYLIGEYSYKYLCSTDRRYSNSYFQKVMELEAVLDYFSTATLSNQKLGQLTDFVETKYNFNNIPYIEYYNRVTNLLNSPDGGCCGISDAPYNNVLYGRINGKWQPIFEPDRTFDADIPVIIEDGKSAGKWVNGDIIPAIGKTLTEVFIDMVTETLAPLISTSLSPTLVEVGGSPNIAVTWSVTRRTNPITAISIGGTSVVPTGNNQSGSTNVTVLNTLGVKTISSVVTDGALSNSDSKNVTYAYRMFAGNVATKPTTSAEVRALDSSAFSTSNQFSYGTGSTNTIFVVAVPPNKNLISVIDLTNLNLDITTQFVPEPITVNDAGGNPVSYTLYVYTTAVPYSANATHQITLANI